jgi:hypothetical protein
MGWSGAGEIFDTVAEVLLRQTENEYIIQPVLVALIRHLQDGDWDTEQESLGAFRDSFVVVESFRECGITPWWEDEE